MSGYRYKTEPFEHQRREVEEHWSDPHRALFWEMGCGKSKALVDTAARLALDGRVDAMLVVAPNGVHRNWTEGELPAHMPEAVPYEAHCYEAAKARTKRHAVACERLLEAEFPVLAMTYDAFVTDLGKKLIWKFLRRRKAFYCLDESRRIKSPGAKRSKSIVASGRYAEYKRIASGTPVANGPFDVFSQVKFLDEEFWRRYGLGSFGAFKTHFGVWESFQRRDTGREFQTCVAYRHLDRLYELLSPITTRLLKEQVLDLPPKLYSIRYFDMSPEQERLYRQLESEYMTILEDGELLTSPLAITRELRLCQVLSGYLPSDENEELRPIGRSNPRLGLLKEVCEEVPHQGIVWARFRRDVDLICETLGREAVRYDGSVPETQRAENKRKFERGEVKWFVGNPAAGGLGLTLTQAKTVIYYNNSYDSEIRQQSEDRAHRIGQTRPVSYIDLCGHGTIDAKIARAHQLKRDVSAEILGDRKIRRDRLPTTAGEA